MANADITLVYFDAFYGRCGPICDALDMGGVPYTFEGVSFAEFGELKPSLPFGSLPVVKLGDDVMYAQSNAILVYAGKRSGMYPADMREALIADEMLAAVEEGYGVFGKSGHEADQDKKKALRKEILDGPLTKWFIHIEAVLERNGSPANLVSNTMFTVADLKLFAFIRMIADGEADFIPADAYTAYPRITAHYEEVKTRRAAAGLTR